MSKLNNLIAIYQTYVQTAENNSTRRLQSNSFYNAVLSLLFSGYIIFIKIGNISEMATALVSLLFAVEIVFIVLCLGLSVGWIYMIKSYKKISDAKFSVIFKLEKKLAKDVSIKCFQLEWDEVNKDKHFLQSHLEKCIPVMFCIVWSIILIFKICHFSVQLNCS